MTAEGSLPRDQVRGDWDAQLDANDSRERWFDPWLTVDQPAANAIVADIMVHYEHNLWPLRRRRPTDAERANTEAAVRIIVANLAASCLDGKPGAVAISRQANSNKRTRYDSPRLATIHAVVDQLSETFQGGQGVRLQASAKRGKVSTVRAGPQVADRLAALSEDAFSQMPGRELIWLRYRPEASGGRRPKGELIDYTETGPTTSMRADVERINSTLRRADIRLRGDTGARPAGPLPPLCRYFVVRSLGDESFDGCGRLFGGWWQGLERNRRADLRVNGEPIADLDFSSMFLRLAYLEANAAPPDGDLYAGLRDLEDPRWREGIKQITASLFSRSVPLQRRPANMAGKLPDGMTGREVRDRLLERHPILAPVMEAGLGLRLMFLESQTLVASLLALSDKGVPALPMHDGLMVATSRADAARNAMSAASRSMLGMELPIILKSFAY